MIAVVRTGNFHFLVSGTLTTAESHFSSLEGLTNMKKKNYTGMWFFISIMSIAFAIGYYQKLKLQKKLNNCSKYTIAKIPKIYKSNGVVKIRYLFKIQNTIVESKTGVGPTDTGEWWEINTENLKNRKLIIKVYCKDYNENSVLWDINVPDTIQYIPHNGWDKIPYGLDKIEK